MIYVLLVCILSFSMVMYFRLADHFNIIDEPNQRSSHSIVTIRGGGIVFYIAALLYFAWSEFQYAFFFLGLTLIAAISFLDDIFTLSNKLRISVHSLAVGLVLYQLDIFWYPWYLIALSLFVVIGIVNAYNFMDGINGITASYSFAVLFLLWLINRQINYIDADYLYFTAGGNFVFFFFNFRNRAKCFAGDVGSVSMSFILLFALFRLILQTQSLIFLLFLAIYGVDVVITITIRLLKGENVFAAHRSHLYQYLANEAGINRLLIAVLYAVLQVVIGYAVIQVSYWNLQDQLLFAFCLLTMLSILYCTIRWYIIKHYFHRSSI